MDKKQEALLRKLSKQLDRQYKQNTDLIVRLEGIYAFLSRVIDRSVKAQHEA